MREFLFFCNNWISRAGIFLLTAAGISWLFSLPRMLGGGSQDPYIGLLFFFAIPAVFFAGLVLVPLGMLLNRRRRIRSGTIPASFPRIAWQDPQFRSLILFTALATLVNIVITGQTTIGAVQYMEGSQFCGQTCHTPMQPEFTAWQHGSHSHVECVKCHIAPGAKGYVHAKWRGAGQLVDLIFNSYPRPIPTPVEDLPSAKQVCDGCHSATAKVGDVLRVVPKYADDEHNSLTKDVLLVHVGSGASGKGIHGAHLSSGVSIRYFYGDTKREEIRRVEYTKNGSTTVFASGKDDPSKLHFREMDCMDCHNRPGHNFELPENAVDRSMASGEISPALPFAKKQSVALLKTSFASREVAEKELPARMENYYRQTYADVYRQHSDQVRRAGKTLWQIYSANIFPDMKVNWGVHPNQLGHNDWTGCNRCHNEKLLGPAGVQITQDCGACHNLLAMDEASPKILNDLGLAPVSAKTR